MATAIPRPSRPTINPPPTGPLPALPVMKTRRSSPSPSALSPSPRFAPISQLPSPSDSQSSPTSAAQSTLPTKLPHANSTSNVPTVSSPLNTPEKSGSADTLRRIASIDSFPQPPSRSIRSAYPPHSSSPTTKALLPAAETSRRSSGPGSTVGSSIRSLERPKTRSNGLATRSRQSDGHLSIPSPPPSRSSSAQSSFSTSDTLQESIDESRRAGESNSSDQTFKGKDGKGNVIISLRVRPDAGSNGTEAEGEWLVDGRRSLISYRGREGGQYYYDNVFTTHDKNAKVYDSAAKRLVRRVMEGYSGTVFAYGMTGTGKTFSMQGTATSPGVIPLAITDIFSFIRETPHREFLLRVSYLEIYNERIYDLLSGQSLAGSASAGTSQQEEIKLREDGKGKVYATPLKEEIVQSPTQLLRVIARGDHARRTGTTQYNVRSSRSHAVVQIVVESRERTLGSGGTLKDSRRVRTMPGGVRVSTLSLIDLAGSEKAAESKEQRTEGAHINKSLLTLGTVIARLSGDKDKQANSSDKDGKHLPYRDSKLTRLLQPALSGDSLISILCTIQIGVTGSIAAASSHTGETLNTLKFAARARNNLVSHAKKAEEALASGDAGSRALLDRYRLEILELRKQLEDQSNHHARGQTRLRDEEEEKARELEAEQRHEEQMLEMQIARTALKERIEHLNRLVLSSKSLGVNSNRSFSSLSMLPRASLQSTKRSSRRSPRSSMSEGTTDASLTSRTVSVASVNAMRPNSQMWNFAVPDAGSEEDDSLGDNGDGTASQTAQIQALQADLADKNRYIITLEKRLLQARRSSHSRVSMSLSPTKEDVSEPSEDGGREVLLRQKDAVITDLRARLAEKERMLTALQSAASKGGASEPRIDVAPSEALHNLKALVMSPVALLSSSKEKRVTGVDDMSKLLDEMIQERVGSRQFNRGANGSGRLAQEKRIQLAHVAVSSIFAPDAPASGRLQAGANPPLS